jgi:cell division septum initiation protein DivIVA
MSAIGQILGVVEDKVRELLTDFVQKNKQQDDRLDKIEKRLDALEAPASSAARKTTQAKPSAAAPTPKATGSK